MYNRKDLDDKIEQLNSLSYNNLEAEIALLSCLVVSNNLLLEVKEEISHRDFSSKENGTIFRIIDEIYTENETVDALTIMQKLEAEPNADSLKKVFLEVIKYPVLVFNIKSYIKNIKISSVKKKVHSISQNMLKITTSEADPRNVIDSASRMLLDLLVTVDHKMQSSYADLSIDHEKFIDKLFQIEELGLTTGIPSLDKLLGGYLPTEVTVIAARPSVGKTSLAVTTALAAAKFSKGSVLFFSLEMNSQKIVERVLSNLSKTSYEKLVDYSDNEIIKLEKKEKYINLLKESGLELIDAPNLSMHTIKNYARYHKMKNPSLKMLVIDYIQLIEDVNNKHENRQSELAKITRDIKTLARELNLPIVVLSQLSRESEFTSGKKPSLFHLKSSGSIEEHFDNIILMHNNKTSLKTQRDEMLFALKDYKIPINLILAKHRNGPTGEVLCDFFPEYSLFLENIQPEVHF